MKVLLVKSVPKVGQAGTVVNVAEGYARNFLFPKKIAVLATAEAVAKVVANKVKQDKTQQLRALAAEKASRSLAQSKFTIKKVANEQGTLFAQVSSDEIAKIVSRPKYPVLSDQIIIAEPLKTIGEHRVFVRLETGEKIPVTIILQPQQ